MRAVDGWVRRLFLDGSLTHPQLTQIPLVAFLLEKEFQKMTIPNTSSGYGWQCPSCKTWVPADQSHACGGSGSQYYTYQPYINPSVLERIAKALESIASQLTKVPD